MSTTPRIALSSRDDLVAWLRELLPDPYVYPRISGSTYPEGIREMEWASRPLWAIFSLMAAGDADEELIAPFIRRLRDGLGAGPLAYADPTLETRQIVIEQEVFGYGLLVCGKKLLSLLNDVECARLESWLNAANEVDLPWGSWLVSRMLVNAGLMAAGLTYDAERLAADVRAVDSMYAGGGWYENGRPYQRDYYIPLAFHFVSLLVSRYAPEAGLKDAVGRAEAFEDDFVQWFDDQGRSIPFGRSVFYRFGQACFWSAEALTGVHARPLGEIKHLLFQHLRWWKMHTVDAPAPLSQGYCYPNLSLVEDYCAPGSPFRAFRAFVVLALPNDDPFWKVCEKKPVRQALRAERKPGMLCVAGPHHSYFFSSMQFVGGLVSQVASRYGKLCYSSAFGWNISRDAAGLSHCAVDSCLALSVAGLDQYSSRARTDVGEVEDRYCYFSWSLGSMARVETWLVPVSEAVHLRVHRIEAFIGLDTCEGSFPIFGWSPKENVPDERGDGVVLLSRRSHDGSLWRSGIADVAAVAPIYLERALKRAGLSSILVDAEWAHRREDVVLQDPNTNIYSYERNAVPVLRARVDAGTTWFATMVSGEPGMAPAD